jgi:preprotein translocase subunit SecF
VRTASLSAAEQSTFRGVIAPAGGTARIERSTDIGPTVGAELYKKSLISMILVALSILIYLAFAFRTPATPEGKKPAVVDDISSWWYGTIAVITLAHDVLIPTGMIAILGHYMGATVDTLFITALLTILGYSVNDTIVIFDRVREKVRANTAAKVKETYEHVVGTALTETYGRSINTSLTALLSLIALFIFGPVSTKLFAATLIAGVVAGTYSSIMLAAPLLVAVHGRKKKSE